MFTNTQVNKYTSMKVTGIITCNKPICLNLWEVTLFHKMTAVCATAVGVTAIGVTAVRNNLKF